MEREHVEIAGVLLAPTEGDFEMLLQVNPYQSIFGVARNSTEWIASVDQMTTHLLSDPSVDSENLAEISLAAYRDCLHEEYDGVHAGDLRAMRIGSLRNVVKRFGVTQEDLAQVADEEFPNSAQDTRDAQSNISLSIGVTNYYLLFDLR